MGYHEKTWLQEFGNRKVSMDKIYDTFCMFGIERMQEIYLKFNIKKTKFTHGKESNIFLSFLDILIKNEKTVFQHQFIERKHQLGCYTVNNFTSMSYKTGLARCLIHYI